MNETKKWICFALSSSLWVTVFFFAHLQALLIRRIIYLESFTFSPQNRSICLHLSTFFPLVGISWHLACQNFYIFHRHPLFLVRYLFFFFFFFFYLYFFLRHYLTCSSFYLAHGPHDPFIYSHDCTCRALFSICLSFAPHQSSIIHTYMYVYISFIRKIAIEDIKQKTVMIHDIHCIFVFCFNTKSRYLVDKCY